MRRYLTYSEADFEVLRPAGAKRCTDGGEIWHGGEGPLLLATFPSQHAHIGPMYVYCGLVGVGTTTLTPAVARKGQLGCVWALCGVYGPALG